MPVAPVLLLEGMSAARAVIRPELTAVGAGHRAGRAAAASRVGAGRAAGRCRSCGAGTPGSRPHFAADRTAAAVDLVVDGAPTLPHDREHYYVRRPGPGAPR